VLPSELHATLHQLRGTALTTARLVRRLGTRLDAFSLDLARDLGAVHRDARAFAGELGTLVRATPRAARIAAAAASLLGRWRWLRIAAAARGAECLSDADHRALARQARAIAGELRGGIAKLAQLASCRPDLVGPIWAGELAGLQDDVPAIDAAAIRARLAAELELGELGTIDAVFATLDDVPLAAASLAQVHAATLHDGTRVVVKVQVPGIEDVIEADLAALAAAASALGEVPGVDLATLVTELRRAFASELDYVAEAAALRRFASAGARVPRPIDRACTRRVLTMTRIDGERLTGWLDHAEPAARDRLLGELVGELAEQILVRGHVHADPHPGNFLVTPEGRLALLDLGCTLELDADERAGYARLVLAIAGGDRANAAAELARLGFVASDPDALVELAGSLVGALRPGAMAAELDWEAAFAAQIAQARQLGRLAIPRSFVLLGRVLAMVAGLLATYRPALQLHAVVAPHLARAIG
jgi:ubiquinone biosynthesis protein